MKSVIASRDVGCPGTLGWTLPKPAAEPNITRIGDVEAGCCAPDQATVPLTPVTPVSTEAVVALHNLITEDARMLD